MLLPLVLAFVLAPGSGSVELGHDAWRALHPAAPAELAVPAWAAERTVQLTAVPGGVLVRASWTLRSLSPGAWFSGQVLGAIPGMRVEHVAWAGRPAAARTTADGVTVAGRVTGDVRLELLAFIPGEPTREPLALTLLPAVRGHVEVTPPEGLVADLRVVDPALAPREAPPPEAVPPPLLPVANTPPPPAGSPPDAVPPPLLPVASTPPPPTDDPRRRDPASARADVPASDPTPALALDKTYWTAAARLDLSFTAPPSPAARDTILVARAGLGLTVGDAELRGRARLVWEVRQGTIDAVDFTASGTGPDLEIKGANVRAVRRSGDSVHVELQAPMSGRLELDLAWTAPLARTAEARLPLPQIRFAGVFRSESTLQLARDGEVEAVPDLTDMAPTTAAALPAWGQGLVDGTPTAAWRGGADPRGALDLLRFVPIEGPPVVIDVAAYTIATSREGRALIRAHYEVRNERAATLRVRPPPGFEVLGVRVGGATATPARDRDGAWRIPLQRSVETVSGALSFPVEIALLGGSDPWDRRERRTLPLPILDAPVAVARVTLHLPPGYRSRLDPGDGDVVAAFTRGDGITYGLGVGAVGAAEADATFQSAVKNWLGNDFDAAQADLDKLRAMGASNENITRLQGNLDVIAGRGDKDDRGVQRRIREQARARSVADQQLQDELRTQAEESRKSGDYEAAESQYRAAIAVGDRLAKLEQRESVEQSTRNQSIAQELESTAGESATRKRRSKLAQKKQPPRSFAGKAYSFESDVLAGDEGDKPASVAWKRGMNDTTGATPPADPATTPAEIASDATLAGITGATTKSPGPADPAKPADITGATTRVVADATTKSPGPADPAVITGTTTSENTHVVDGATATTEPPVQEPRPAPPPAPPTGRTFTAVVDVTPGATADAGAATPTADAPDQKILDVEATQIKAERALISVVKRQNILPGARRRARRGARDARDAAPTETRPDAPADAPAQDVLPEPRVTASAVSVVVPQVGRAVLYQRLLLPADAPHAIAISAREPLLAKD